MLGVGDVGGLIGDGVVLRHDEICVVVGRGVCLVGGCGCLCVVAVVEIRMAVGHVPRIVHRIVVALHVQERLPDASVAYLAFSLFLCGCLLHALPDYAAGAE